MKSTATTPDQYFDSLPDDRKQAMTELRETIRKNLPKGFEETMSYGMVSYVVPHALYPAGYHCDPKQPLPFISIASQKNFIAVYHMGLYASPDVMKWFAEEYPKHNKKKMDMGKSCLRFKKPGEIPITLLSQLFSKMTPANWITIYEQQLKK